jgi:MoxR-like ATPase
VNPALTHIHDTLHAIKAEVQKEIIGQDGLIEKLLITIFAGGHALLEGVPWLGKTKTIRTLAEVLDLETKRISFTPDLLPSDLTGNEAYRPQKWEFYIRKGPIFTSILLADEINRTPPKVQSALLEAMEEKKVTIGEKTFDLPSPFFVFATQNPLEHEGTYPLPEAQLDRFLMRIVLDYPSSEDEKRIFLQETWKTNTDTHTNTMEKNSSPLLGETERGTPPNPSYKEGNHTESTVWKSSVHVSDIDILEMTDYIVGHIHVDEKIYDYVSNLLTATRKLVALESRVRNQEHETARWILNPAFWVLSYGASTRAGLSLIRAGRVRALMAGRDYMMPEDVKYLAHDILDHRIGLSYEAIGEWYTTHQVLANILDTVKVP